MRTVSSEVEGVWVAARDVSAGGEEGRAKGIAASLDRGLECGWVCGNVMSMTNADVDVENVIVWLIIRIVLHGNERSQRGVNSCRSILIPFASLHSCILLDLKGC